MRLYLLHDTGRPARFRPEYEEAEPMNISSVLVNARPERIDEVRGGLLALDGVEIHAATEEGRMIVTIEIGRAHV